MERLTYYHLADSENMGYYLNPGVTMYEAVQRLGEIESAIECLGISSVPELVGLAHVVQIAGRAWETRRNDRQQTQIQFKNGSSLAVIDSSKNVKTPIGSGQLKNEKCERGRNACHMGFAQSVGVCYSRFGLRNGKQW